MALWLLREGSSSSRCHPLASEFPRGVERGIAQVHTGAQHTHACTHACTVQPRGVCLCCPSLQSEVPTDSRHGHLPGMGGAGRLGAGGAGVVGGGGGRRAGAAGMAGGLAAGGSSLTWPDGGRADTGRLGNYTLHAVHGAAWVSSLWLAQAAATVQRQSPRRRKLDNRAPPRHPPAPPRPAPPRPRPPGGGGVGGELVNLGGQTLPERSQNSQDPMRPLSPIPFPHSLPSSPSFPLCLCKAVWPRNLGTGFDLFLHSALSD